MKNKMKIVLAPDSYKESMTALEACDAMEKGIKKIDENIECIKVPMADGGEGTTRSLVDATGGELLSVEVLGPLGKPVNAKYGILGGGKIAVLEMASASGLELVSLIDRNPMITSTYGTGQLIKACLQHPIEKILIGIGGSATNDGGAGMIEALGGKLLDKSGNIIERGGKYLKDIESIDLSQVDKRLKDIEIIVACDVNNPLIGDNGASQIFGPQKGATPEMVKELDLSLKHFGEVINKSLGIDIITIAGAGAAGGLGAGLMAFLGGILKPGIDMVIEYSGIEDKIKDADMVWTGEGSIDNQTVFGKTPYGVAKLAKKYDKPVIALVGAIGEKVDMLYENGIDSIFSMVTGAMTLEDAFERSEKNLENLSENITRMINIFK
ncbi:MAG: glycerate kinase [Firmicutes bacterium]|jgi:glycerate kinase|nr:glycerate kinase [Bacillota bacterium]